MPYTLDILMTNIELHAMEVIMARAEQRARVGELRSQSDFSPALRQSNCRRCGGFMVKEVSMDLWNSTSELECATRRCVQCGDILDPVILQNRCIRREPTTVQHTRQPYRARGHNREMITMRQLLLGHYAMLQFELIHSPKPTIQNRPVDPNRLSAGCSGMAN
jgi:RNase P subunit RPR2